MNKLCLAVSGAALCMAAGSASAQVVINEIFENPPGSSSVTDVVWEFIELYGKPGMDLTGYAIGALKGGLDSNDDGIPDGPFDDRVPEIDEAFQMDGWSIGPDGFFVLVNANAFGSSTAGSFLIPNPSYNSGLPESPSNKRWLNGATFQALHIPTTDTAGNLNNDGSSSFVLVRRRYDHSISGGVSVYGPDYAFRKDVDQDVEFDGKADFGVETAVAPITSPPSMVEHYQMVDDFAWSNGGGKEYLRSSQQEISDTPSFNPDAVSRLRYFAANPGLGHRTRELSGGGFEILATRIADESFVYGELRTAGQVPLGQPVFPASLAYNHFPDSVTGHPQAKGPTDPDAVPFDGSCDPEPEAAANPGCLPNVSGSYFFTDVNVAGFEITPGDFNDHPTDTSGKLTQFRFWFSGGPSQAPVIAFGDFDMNGVVDTTDLAMILARLGDSLDATTPAIFDNATPEDSGDDVAFDEYIYQGLSFQQHLMMMCMDETDGPGGVNAEFVTEADIAALEALLPADCPGDADGSGTVDFGDLNIVLSGWQSTVTPGTGGDLDGDGDVDFDDLNIILSNWNTEC